MKKKLAIHIVIVAILVAALFYYFIPRRPIRDIYSLDSIRVRKAEESGDLDDITDKIDQDELKETLSTLMCSGFPRQYTPYEIKNISYEIDCIYTQESVHIVLGGLNIISTNSNSYGYKIDNYKDVLLLLENSISN